MRKRKREIKYLNKKNCCDKEREILKISKVLKWEKRE